MPRGRPRKPRLSRMDAAVDAMAQLGFPEDKVKKHVKELLKAYGGDDGWPFIEEYSYKELIEAILRDEEGGAKENSFEDERAVGTSSSRVSETQLENEGPQDSNLLDDTTKSPSGAVSEVAHSTSGINGGEGGAKAPKDILADHQMSVHIEESADTVCKNGEEDPPRTQKHPPGSIQTIPALPSPNTIPSPLPTNSLPTSRRLPCYGWIESDEDEDIDDFVYLKPAPGVLGPPPATLPHELMIAQKTKSVRKRRSRWDQRPDDP